MSPEQNRKFNLVAGSVFLLMGIATWGLTAYYAYTPSPPRPAPLVMASVTDLTSCRNALSNQGYQATFDQEKLTVSAFESFSEDTKGQLDKVTMNIGLCKMDLHEFCMGESCSAPGVSFTLKRSDLVESARKAVEAASSRTKAAALAGAAVGAGAAKAVAAKPAAKQGAKPAAKPAARPAARPANNSRATPRQPATPQR